MGCYFLSRWGALEILIIIIIIMIIKVLSEDFVLLVASSYVSQLFGGACGLQVVSVDVKRAMFSLVFPKGSSVTKPFSQMLVG